MAHERGMGTPFGARRRQIACELGPSSQLLVGALCRRRARRRDDHGNGGPRVPERRQRRRLLVRRTPGRPTAGTACARRSCSPALRRSRRGTSPAGSASAGRARGANGGDAWIQAGIASMPGLDPFVYAEITREGQRPRVHGLARGRRGRPQPQDRRPRDVAVGKGWWRIWLDGQAVTAGSAARVVRALGADRDGRELERQVGRRATVRLPVRARLGLVRRRRLVAAVRLRAPLPRRGQPARATSRRHRRSRRLSPDAGERRASSRTRSSPASAS